MDTTIETVHSSLAQRIAKVRNCMFVEVATGISPTNKELFVALCQSYEQQSVVTSCLSDELQESLLHWASSVGNVMQEATQLSWLMSSILSQGVPLSERGIGFVVTNRINFSGPDAPPDFTDWDKASGG